MSDRILDLDTLATYLPHRGVNLFPDQITLHADGQSSTSRTRFLPADPRGRLLLGRQSPGGRPTWAEPFLMELLALTGVPLLKARLPAGHESVFSMISRLTLGELPDLHAEVVGSARITRDRGGFTVFECQASADGRLALSAEVMSGSASLAAVQSAAPRPFAQAPAGEAAPPYAWKDARLRFIDRLLSEDRAAGSLRCAYTYPSDHPFVPGHFPGGALMMGVTQWSAVADAGVWAMQRFGLAGPCLVQGRVLREDGAEILDVRDLGLRIEGGVPLLASCKRIAFREPVRPGDGIVVEVRVAPLA